ncbi:MAG TPA: C39 family peptidase [Polyangiaceae bacterium]|nr:C39 family peptidase [Polyangiaceae bacterium]
MSQQAATANVSPIVSPIAAPIVPVVAPVVTPLPANLVQVPVVTQRRDFSCGPAATLSVLRYWRPEAYGAVDESDLYASLETTNERGTEPEPMEALLRKSGLDATYRFGDVTIRDLEQAIDAKEPPIVDLQAWTDHEEVPYRGTWDAGHYVVMVGYDAERLYFADPSTMTPHGYVFLSRPELEERWHDLAGAQDQPVERMAIFVRGPLRSAVESVPPPGAVKLL